MILIKMACILADKLQKQQQQQNNSSRQERAFFFFPFNLSQEKLKEKKREKKISQL